MLCGIVALSKTDHGGLLKLISDVFLFTQGGHALWRAGALCAAAAGLEPS